MSDLAHPEHFNPCPDSSGFVLFEHWETTGPDEYHLLNIAATPLDMTLAPGDWIIRRRWAPGAEPTLYSRARLRGPDQCD